MSTRAFVALAAATLVGVPRAVEAAPNLVSHRERIAATYFPGGEAEQDASEWSPPNQ